MLEKQYFIIYIKDNNLMEVCEIDEERYNYFDYTFNYVYHTKNGDTYKLDKDLERGIDTLIVDGNHLYELLDDLREQGFCDTIEFKFIDDYFNGNYKQYGQAF